VKVEICVGLLDPAIEGTPYKTIYDFEKNGVEILSFSDKSEAYNPEL